MIFNWYLNCKDVVKNGKYTDNDAYDHKTIRKQETFLIRYFIVACKYDKEKTYQRWLNISGGTADLFKHDEEQCRLEFERLFNASKKVSAEGFEKLRYRIRVFKHEIDYLNSLEAPLWVRQYWLGLMFWYKYMNCYYQQVAATVSVEGWVFRQVDNEHEFKHKHGEINTWARKCGFPFKKDVSKNGTLVTADWTGVKTPVDKVVAIYTDPSEFVNYLNLLLSGTKVCRLCGRHFDFSSKTKRDICERCWERKEKARKRRKK